LMHSDSSWLAEEVGEEGAATIGGVRMQVGRVGAAEGGQPCRRGVRSW
jgi:hypothetical protein